MRLELLHYEVAWFNSDGVRLKEYFEDIKSALLFANTLKERSNITPVIYQLSRVKEFEKV